MEKNNIALWTVLSIGGVVALILIMMYGIPAYNRGQKLLTARNEVLVNEIRIKQTEQLVNVEKQKAEIKITEAHGIAEAQKIINATLTDKYLQHEAISAQKEMANSANHTTVYIPSGQNGIPIVKTLE